ncbi:MAG: PDZ domain-containing protein [Acidobacteriaceae bacterium]|nr:PDZ domain-containing protein [Acidobacteriaceae bacterium]
MKNTFLVACAVVAMGLMAAPTPRAASAAVEKAFAKFWSASSPGDAEKAAADIVKSGVSFDDALAAFKHGRTYPANPAKGVVRLSHMIAGTEFAYMVDVPKTYTPAKKYQVRVQLHGGVGRPDAAPRGNGIGALAGVEQIYILPTAWADAEWWTDRQLQNLRWILDHVKRTYNVDENRVVLSGVSDGGTGTYYFSMRDTTPFASFLPLNGAIAVLRSSNVALDGELYMQNLLNKPFFIVNGGRDPLYPTTLVEPYINQMKQGGVELMYLPQPDAVHNTVWWPEVKDTYETFVAAHPRNPYPDTLTWESDMTAGTNRAHWLVIDTLAPATTESAKLPDMNDLVSASTEPSFGIRSNGTRVTAVTAGSNADRFGIKPGDVISAIGPRQIPPPVDIIELLAIYDPGTPLALTVVRGNATIELKGTYQPASASRVTSYFAHRRPSGRVDLVRTGNTVTATTRGVGSFTLLLSPDVFDFLAPVKVVVDGKTVHDGVVKQDLATLARWAARDNDRTQLFGAELKVNVPR